MRIFKDYNQKQTFLPPPSVEEFVPAEHSARIISDVIDTIDLNSIVGEYTGGGSGIPDGIKRLFRQPEK